MSSAEVGVEVAGSRSKQQYSVTTPTMTSDKVDTAAGADTNTVTARLGIASNRWWASRQRGCW